MTNITDFAPHAIARTFFDAESDLQGIIAASDAQFYSTLRSISSRFGQVDALYVCLYDGQEGKLHFLYNCCGERFDSPETVPLGEGPTSWVVRNGRELVILDGLKPAGIKFTHFGNLDQVTRSQLHLPLFEAAEAGRRVVGVFSIQAIKNGAYDPEQLDAYRWLSLRLSIALQRRVLSDGATEEMNSAILRAANDAASQTAQMMVF